MSASTQEQFTRQIESWLATNQHPDASEKGQLRDLLRAALELNYVSESCRGGIQTGNHYQSVRLGETVTAGFRSDRAELLDQINFEGRTVLDLGSNLGEVSRSARTRGATRVVGIEYDPFFVSVARGLNVLNGVTDVEFRQGDIGDPAVFTEDFDIVLALSVFQYVGSIIGDVCRKTRDVLVVETHKLDDNLESHYVEPISRLMPACRHLGRSDWGASFEDAGERAVVAFARDADALARGLTPAAQEGMGLSRRVTIDVAATGRALHARFFTTFDFEKLDDLLYAVKTTDVDLGAMGRNEVVHAGYRGWLYWFMFLKGYMEYLERGAVRDDNTFCRYLTDYHLPNSREPGVDYRHVTTAAERRFDDLQRMSAAPDADVADLHLNPVRVTVGELPPPSPLRVRLASGESVFASLVDGWHRIFSATVAGVPTLPALLVYEEYLPVRGRVEYYESGEEMIRIDGWCLSSDSEWQFMELRADGRALDRVPPIGRPDVARNFPTIPHAGASGFSFACALPSNASTLELLPMRGWLPLGRLMLYRAGTNTNLVEVAETTRLAEARRALDSEVSSGRVLVVDSESVEAVACVFGRATVVGVSHEPADWGLDAGSADLIVGGRALEPLNEVERFAWLDRAAKALRVGGVLMLWDRGWMPDEVPTDLNSPRRIGPDPVEAVYTVLQTRV
jgi:hypothetical protein